MAANAIGIVDSSVFSSCYIRQHSAPSSASLYRRACKSAWGLRGCGGSIRSAHLGTTAQSTGRTAGHGPSTKRAWPLRPQPRPSALSSPALPVAHALLTSSHSVSVAARLCAPSCHRSPAPRRSHCHAALGSDFSQVAALLTAQPPSWAATLAVNALVFSLGYPVLRSGLTPSGVVSSFLLGTAAWKGFGLQGYVVVCLYFLLGTAVTKLRLREKQAEGIAEQRSGRRGPGSVVGSAASAVACAVGATLGVGASGAAPLWQLGYVASFCTKLSDTTASEVGKAYGKTTYLVTTLALVPRGTEGAVSLEGTLAGLLAAAALAGVACLIGLVDPSGAALVVVASQVANLFESWVGATSQGKQGREWLSNDLVNVLNISMGTALAILLRVALVGGR